MKQSDLHRRYADTVDMFEGTGIKPYIRYFDTKLLVANFDGDITGYKFPLAIVENKPVFEGDVLYHKDGSQCTVQKIEKHNDSRIAFITVAHPFVDGDWIENYSWNQQKDGYAELKQAQKDGKRIAWKTGGGAWSIQGHISDELFSQHHVDRWKVVEDDLIIEFPLELFNKTVRVRGVKSGLYGNITLKVVE